MEVLINLSHDASEFLPTDAAADDTPGPRYRYRRQHVIQSLMVSSDESESSDSDSDVDTADSNSR